MRRAAFALAGTALALHAGPLATSIAPLRRRLLPQLHGLGRADHVALTFDDGPDPASTPAFLAALDELHWKATFFMLGSMVRKDPVLAEAVASAGHEVAVHGDEHRSALWRRPRAVIEDVARALDTVATTTGTNPVWFRPPYGVLTGSGVLASRRAGLRTIMWTTWGRDWRAAATPATVVADVLAELEPGATVLLHDSDCTGDPGAWRSSLAALPRLAEAFAARGLTVGTLADHGVGDPSGSGA